NLRLCDQLWIRCCRRRCHRGRQSLCSPLVRRCHRGCRFRERLVWIGTPMEVEIRVYSLGLRSNGLYVVKIDVTTFHRLANLRGGTIEFQPDLQLLEPVYLRDQPCPYFFNGTVESVQFSGLALKIARGLAN